MDRWIVWEPVAQLVPTRNSRSGSIVREGERFRTSTTRVPVSPSLNTGSPEGVVRRMAVSNATPLSVPCFATGGSAGFRLSTIRPGGLTPRDGWAARDAENMQIKIIGYT